MAAKKEVVKIEKASASMDAIEVNDLIARAIDKGVPVETMEKLLAMRQQLKAEWAREQYQAALSAFQADCPIIKKDKVVMNKDGRTERYRYAPIDSIIKQVRSLIEKHGFNYRADAEIEGRTVNATCIVTHKHGHSERSSFSVPIDPEAYMNEAQKYAAALTFAKRYAFCDAFGIFTGDADVDSVVIASASPTQGHRRTKQYEEETGVGDPKVQKDLAELKEFLAKNEIPEGFLLRLLEEKKMIDGHTKTVDTLKPGILLRCLAPATKENLVKAWAVQRADEHREPEKKGQRKTAAPEGDAPPTKAKKEDPHPFDRGEPVRTTEGDQRRGRKPIIPDIAPKDVLEQEGIDNWRKVKIHFGEKAGTPLGKLPAGSLRWWIENYKPKPFKGTWQEKDLLLDAALCLASAEMEAG